MHCKGEGRIQNNVKASCLFAMFVGIEKQLVCMTQKAKLAYWDCTNVWHSREKLSAGPFLHKARLCLARCLNWGSLITSHELYPRLVLDYNLWSLRRELHHKFQCGWCTGSVCCAAVKWTREDQSDCRNPHSHTVLLTYSVAYCVFEPGQYLSWGLERIHIKSLA